MPKRYDTWRELILKNFTCGGAQALDMLDEDRRQIQLELNT